MSTVCVIDHPLIQYRLTILRDRGTPAPLFRQLLCEIGELMIYEMARDLPTEPMVVETPLEKTIGQRLKIAIHLVTILRAGITMVDGMAKLLPHASIGHLGIYRNEQTLQPVIYFKKLPPFTPEDRIILVDPMLATGGSAVASLELLQNAGAKNLYVATLIAAPEGIKKIQHHFPEVSIYTAAVDRQLNANGYILPGLGDAGDRQFNTMPISI
ncbi:MAG: uracil phosphoribosyltransferase [candidate division KSB1 bacterium]|nr:uracil phosphoribosyltransferase [candidate division KSB1 bacterium]